MKKALLSVLAVIIIASGCFVGYELINKDEYEIPNHSIEYTDTLYVWNENQDSSPEGVRYALFKRSEKERPLSKIFSKGTDDYDKVFAEFSQVTDYGMEVCEIYSYDGYEVPDNIITKILDYSSIGGSRICTRTYRQRGDSSTLKIQGVGKLRDIRYSAYLDELDEGSIRDVEGEVYRFCDFISIPEENVVYKVTVTDEGGELVYKKSVSDIGGQLVFTDYSAEIIDSKTISLNKKQISNLRRALRKIDFWNLVNMGPRIGADGSECVVEGVKDGKYHITERWTPKVTNSEYEELCQAFRNLLPDED